MGRPAYLSRVCWDRLLLLYLQTPAEIQEADGSSQEQSKRDQRRDQQENLTPVLAPWSKEASQWT